MAGFQHLDLQQARALIEQQDALVADIRDAQSFAMGHIPSAQHLSNENLHQFVLANDHNKPLIVVCYHGVSSQGAAQYLAEQGFTDVYSLDGGFTAWQAYQPDLVVTSHV